MKEGSNMKTNEDPWTLVPILDTDNLEGSAITPSSRVSRRTFGAALVVLGGAAALAILRLIPAARPARLWAAVGTEHTNNCGGYDSWAGYNDNSEACVPYPYGSEWCGSDGWFKIASGTGYSMHPVVICGSPQKNAWRWTHDSVEYRCADGVYWVQGVGGAYRICSYEL